MFRSREDSFRPPLNVPGRGRQIEFRAATTSRSRSSPGRTPTACRTSSTRTCGWRRRSSCTCGSRSSSAWSSTRAGGGRAASRSRRGAGAILEQARAAARHAAELRPGRDARAPGALALRRARAAAAVRAAGASGTGRIVGAREADDAGLRVRRPLARAGELRPEAAARRARHAARRALHGLFFRLACRVRRLRADVSKRLRECACGGSYGTLPVTSRGAN